MTHVPCSKMSRSAAILAELTFCIAALAVAPRPAMAVIVEGGRIGTDGSSSTVDRFYFTMAAGGMLGLSAVELGGNPPLVGWLAFKVYQDDGVLDAAE